MGFYNDVILPRLCDFAMRNKRLVPYRERVIGAAEGQVIEIGIGSGLNLPFYRPVVKEILAIEPAPKLVTMARRAPRPEIRIKFIEASAEAIPIEDHSVDTVVTTWTLCTIPQAATALTEMRRVLRPGGRLKLRCRMVKRVEVAPTHRRQAQVNCAECGGPLRNRDGKFVLKYRRDRSRPFRGGYKA